MEKIVVRDEDTVLRRIPNKPSHVKSDGSLSSANFIGPDTSVNIERLTTIEETMAGFEKFGVARLLTRQIRGIGEDVMHDPIEGNDAHAIIPGKRTISIARSPAGLSTMIIPPALEN